MDREQGLTIVQSVVADCLEVDDEEVTVASRLTVDLGADSLDFIDLVFTLEQRFGVKIREGEFDFLARIDLSDPAVMKGGFLTPEAIQNLQIWLPELSAKKDSARLTPPEIFELITVGTLWRVVERSLNAEKNEDSQ